MVCKLAFSSASFFKILTVTLIDFSVSFDILLFNFLDKGRVLFIYSPYKKRAFINIVTDCAGETLSPVICNKYRSVWVY